VLSTGTAVTCPSLQTVVQQLFGGECRGVRHG
jgi:hypothetical protein